MSEETVPAEQPRRLNRAEVMGILALDGQATAARQQLESVMRERAKVYEACGLNPDANYSINPETGDIREQGAPAPLAVVPQNRSQRRRQAKKQQQEEGA